MTTPLIEKLNITSSVSIVIISISLMLFGGFAMTRITKRLKLPNVTAYIVAGILMGPYCLNLIPVGLIERMDFIADIALAFIAFSTGEFFRFSTLKKSGVKVLLITFLEACLASIAVFIATHYVLGLDMVFSVVLAALASATAPASTMMTIRQTHFCRHPSAGGRTGRCGGACRVQHRHFHRLGLHDRQFSGAKCAASDNNEPVRVCAGRRIWFDFEVSSSQAINRQSPNRIYCTALCILRNLCADGRFVATGLYVHVDDLHQYLRRRKAF